MFLCVIDHTHRCVMPVYECTYLHICDVCTHMPFHINEAATSDCCFTFARVYTLLYLECFHSKMVNSGPDDYFGCCFSPFSDFTPVSGAPCRGTQLCLQNALEPSSRGTESVPLFRDYELYGFVWRASQTWNMYIKYVTANQWSHGTESLGKWLLQYTAVFIPVKSKEQMGINAVWVHSGWMVSNH